MAVSHNQVVSEFVKQLPDIQGIHFRYDDDDDRSSDKGSHPPNSFRESDGDDLSVRSSYQSFSSDLGIGGIVQVVYSSFISKVVFTREHFVSFSKHKGK